MVIQMKISFINTGDADLEAFGAFMAHLGGIPGYRGELKELGSLDRSTLNFLYIYRNVKYRATYWHEVRIGIGSIESYPRIVFERLK